MRALALLAVLTACNPATTDSKPAEAAKPVAASAGGSGGLPAGTEDSAVVASWEGGSVTYGDLAGEVKSKVTQLQIEYLTQRYQAESQALESMMMSEVLDLEVKAQGVASPEALLAKEVEAKVTPPTEAEKREFYEVVKRQLRGQPYEMVEPQVAAELLRRKQSERFTVYMEELKTKYKVKLQLPYPDLPRIEVSVDDDPSIGPADAPITIVQFAEYQCPYCGKANESLEQVMKEYEGKVRMVYRDFPLSFHDRAIPAAVAANCAGDQGKYWEMHEVLMANQGALQESDLQGYASKLALDLSKWESCRQDPAQAAEVQKDMADGAEAGVSGTPAFFINGIMLSGAQPFSEFKTVIDRELGEG
jgi:protein-disulfide isomerase